ncbi:hypothetical protein BSZ19_35515 [Bradyrhizobium japonicum]|uniref:ABC transmembrane type-1 domain-containing protein n=1 Tax=Bradyrhizobium japonicum TaxID=375 RepID=A0A1Y2JEA3_BRAJP|nr:ABC transporter permease [Bradyrhizobium japonicum]OSJ26577.1 hypothetical protein BSZ19_35515 [Bradyrhizobium japonicum]
MLIDSVAFSFDLSRRAPAIQQPMATWLRVGAASALWILLWWAIVTLLHVPADFLPTPVSVVRKLFTMTYTVTGDGALWVHVGRSLYRFTLGFVLAVFIGVPLGFAMGYVRPLNNLVSPLFEFFRCIPPIAWAPFAMLWFGASIGAQVFVIFTAALPPILINAYKGIKLVDPGLINAARSLGAKPATMLLEVGLPSSLPVLIAGLRIGIANGWMALVGAEIIAGAGTHSGLGFLILVGQDTLQANLAIGAMVLIGAVGVGFDWLFLKLQKRMVRWA